MNRGGLAHSQRVPSWPRCGGGQSEGKSEERLGRNLAAGSALELFSDVLRLWGQWPKRTCPGSDPDRVRADAGFLRHQLLLTQACPFGTCLGSGTGHARVGQVPAGRPESGERLAQKLE